MTEQLIESKPDTASIAASLARYGWEVFPVRLTQVTTGGRERRDKTPLVTNWTKGVATTDPGDIFAWWQRYPWAHVGVFAGGSRLVTVDIDRNDEKDGFASLERAEVRLPPTLRYSTLGGGEHHVYSAPDGEWTLGSNIAGPGGNKLMGVDVRAGGSYFVYYGPRLTTAPQLSPAPEFALIEAGSRSSAYDLSVQEWIRLLPEGPPSTSVLTALSEIRPQRMSHDDMLHSVGVLVRLGRDYHGGVRDALARGREIYSTGWEPKYGRMWDLAVEGSVKHWGPPRDLSFEFDEADLAGPRPEPPIWRAADFAPEDAFMLLENGKRKLDAELLRHVVNPHGDLALGVDGRIWVYAGGRYVVDDDAPTRRAVQVLRGMYQRYSSTLVRDMVIHSEGFPRLSDDPPDAALINVRNGMYNWRERRLLPHSPSYLSQVQLPVTYDPEATCPRFEQWLSQVLEPDLIPVAWEVLAYTLMSGNPFQKVALLVGPPHAGKGTFLRVIQRLLGEENIAHLTVKGMSEPFGPATLYGRIANIVGDAPTTKIPETADFKMIVAGDRVQAQYKHKPLFHFIPWAFHIFAANRLPKSGDDSGGWLRRWTLVPFKQTVAVDRSFRESDLHDEAAGIFLKAVGHLPELMSRKHFSEPLSTLEPMAALRVLSDPVAMWLAEDESVTVDPGDSGLRTLRTETYKTYRRWVEETGSDPALPAQDVYARLREMGHADWKSGGRRFLLGIRVNPNKQVLTNWNPEL